MDNPLKKNMDSQKTRNPYIALFHFFLLLEAAKGKKKESPIGIFSGMALVFSLSIFPLYAVLISCDIPEVYIILLPSLTHLSSLTINYFVYNSSDYLRAIDLTMIPKNSIKKAQRILGFTLLVYIVILLSLAHFTHVQCFSGMTDW